MGHYLQMEYRLRVLSSVMFVSVSLFAAYLRDWGIALLPILVLMREEKKLNDNSQC